MSLQVIETSEQCFECGMEFRPVQVSDPRKGYDVLHEDAEGWTICCKGCDSEFVIEK